MIKHILVKENTHCEVDKVRAEHKLKTFDEAVQHLLKRPEFTEEELKVITLCVSERSINEKIKEAIKNG